MNNSALLGELIDYVAVVTDRDEMAMDSVKTGEVEDEDDLAYQKSWWDGAIKGEDGWVNDEI